MPRFNKYRKAFRKGKHVYTKAKAALPIAKEALAGVQKLYRTINSEVHHNDIANSATATNAGIVVLAHTIAQGDTDITRTGSSIRPMTLSGVLTFTINGASTTEVLLRAYIIKAKQERGTAPTWATVFNAAATGGEIIKQAKLWDNRFNTKILWDSGIVKVSPNNVDGVGLTTRKVYIKCFGHIQYTNGASTAEDGGYYLFFASDQASNQPAVGHRLRLTFHDN